MKKNLFIAVSVVLLAVLFLAGCTSMAPIKSNTQYPADGSKYVILGRVTAEMSDIKAGYTLLVEEAKKQYPEADDVVNIIVDAKAKSFIFLKFPKYVMSGIAIDYK